MTVVPIEGVRYWYNESSSSFIAPNRPSLPITVDTNNFNWSDTNLPWAYVSTSQFTEKWPAGVNIVNLQTGAVDFYTNLWNTCNSSPGRVVVRLGTGTYHLNQFRLIGSSGSPTYSFGFWHPKLQGFLGNGPDKTFIQMDANSMTTAQLNAIAAMTDTSFAPLQMGMMRIDSSASSPTLIAGITFMAADQQMLTSSATSIVVPQPAPHQGIVFYSDTNPNAIVSYTRFLAAGRACLSGPPFEMADVSSQYGLIKWNNCEFDGRRAAEIDPARPRRCTVWMGNNETLSEITDSWLHHSNVSRYAANDQNRETQGQYTLVRCKLERITDTQNKDPNLNGGNSLGGYTNASICGWESCNGTITVTNCIMSQDDNLSGGGVVPCHLQLTSVGSRNPQGGRMYVNGGTFINTAWPQIDGYLTIRIQRNIYWKLDGYSNTIFVYHPNGQRLSPYEFTGTWPPTAAALAAAGVSNSTHYIVRLTG